MGINLNFKRILGDGVDYTEILRAESGDVVFRPLVCADEIDVERILPREDVVEGVSFKGTSTYGYHVVWNWSDCYSTRDAAVASGHRKINYTSDAPMRLDPIIVDLEIIYRAIRLLDKFNQLSLQDVKFLKHGNEASIDPLLIAAWQYTGSDNIGFVRSLNVPLIVAPYGELEKLIASRNANLDEEEKRRQEKSQQELEELLHGTNRRA